MSELELSFVVPLFNEVQTIAPLFEKIHRATVENKISNYEVIFIDDGSWDLSWNEITKLGQTYPKIVKGIKFRRNFGKAQALSTGFEASKGKVVFSMDADLQDDPGEIGHFLKKINEGYDLVSGWKKRRHDPLGKTLPSKLFNAVTARITKIPLHDFNCGFKAYRRLVVKSIKIYGDLHRFTPVLASELGFKVTEVEVLHHPREHGKSKYGWERFARGLLDLMSVMATTQYRYRPGHLFGGIGLLIGTIGFGVLTYLSIIWFAGRGPIGGRPLLTFGVLCFITSIQLISLGVLAELINRSAPSPLMRQLVEEDLNIQI